MLKYLELFLRLPGWYINGRKAIRNPGAVTLGWLSRGRYLPDEIVLRNGWRIGLSGHPHDAITAFVVFFKRDYAPPVASGSIVLDAGANIGCYTFYCLLSGAAKVHCVEASSGTLEVLRRNIEMNGLQDRVILHHNAIWKTDAETVFIGLRSSPHNKVSSAAEEESEPVSTVTLDKLLASEPKQDWSVKLDIEGAEAAALEGLTQPERISRFDIEFHNEAGLAAARRLSDHGFRVMRCDQDRPTIGIIQLRREF